LHCIVYNTIQSIDWVLSYYRSYNNRKCINLSLQGNESQVGGNRNDNYKVKSNFEKPVTVDYKSKQFCAKGKKLYRYSELQQYF